MCVCIVMYNYICMEFVYNYACMHTERNHSIRFTNSDVLIPQDPINEVQHTASFRNSKIFKSKLICKQFLKSRISSLKTKNYKFIK